MFSSRIRFRSVMELYQVSLCAHNEEMLANNCYSDHSSLLAAVSSGEAHNILCSLLIFRIKVFPQGGGGVLKRFQSDNINAPGEFHGLKYRPALYQSTSRVGTICIRNVLSNGTSGSSGRKESKKEKRGILFAPLDKWPLSTLAWMLPCRFLSTF